LWSGIAPIMGSDLPRRPLRGHLSARLFGGASGGVFRGMATLALGSGIGRVIGLAAIPVLTRLYTPEDFGALAVFTALVAILAPLVTLRYVLALPLPRHDGVAMNLLVLSFGLMLVFCALIALALGLWGGALLTLVSMQVLAPWWWLIALGVLGTATYEMLTMWATRKRAYRVIAQTNVTQSAAGAVVKIGLGLAAWAPLGLLVGQVVAQTGGIGRLITGFGAELRAQWHHVRASRIRKAAWRHRGFPIWRVPSQFLMVFAQQLPILLFAAYYNDRDVGYVSVVFMVLNIAVNIIGASLSRSIYGEIAHEGLGHHTVSVLTRTSWITFALCLPISGVLALGGPMLASVLLGPEWVTVGELLRYLAIYLPFALVAVSLSTVFNVIGVQSAYLFANLIRVAVIFASMLISINYGADLHGAFLAYIFSISAYQLFFIFFTMGLAKRMLR
jgi:O-antigen/teichoic acid export membrane protein